MNLSNILFDNLTTKLKINDYSLIKERSHIENLVNQINYLKKLKKENHKRLGFIKFETSDGTTNTYDDLMITYVVNISFLRANTMIHISDTEGNLKLFYSAGSVGLTGKQKKNRRIATVKLISLLIKKATFLNGKPIALHLNNVNFYQNLIINKLKQAVYIKIIKSFNQTPYNGCRKRKVRRKKYVKKFK